VSSGSDTPTVVVTDRRFEEDVYTDPVEAEGGEVVFADVETESGLVEVCREAAVVVAFRVPVTRPAVEAMESARLIFQNAAGYDTVAVAAATEQSIPVSTPRGYAADEVAEHAIALALAAARDVVTADRGVREARGFGERGPITPLSGGTFGAVGLGTIGTAAVKKARGLGLEAIAADPYAPPSAFEGGDIERTTLPELLERADVVSLHCPLTAETRRLIGAAELDRMDRDAVLVNTARGGIVDETALVAAVEDGRIGGAGIDVFETEPPAGSPALDCPGIVCSPHHGGICDRVLDRAKRLARAEVRRALRGEHPRNVVNPEALMYDEDSEPTFEIPE